MIASAPAWAASATWIEAVLHGPLAIGAAVLAVASLGYAMLEGRLEPRRIAQILIGMFILFSAPQIARALADLARGQEAGGVAAEMLAPGQAAPEPAITQGAKVICWSCDPQAGDAAP
jgi:type IV secretory pathway VirB2 component (pilin)